MQLNAAEVYALLLAPSKDEQVDKQSESLSCSNEPNSSHIYTSYFTNKFMARNWKQFEFTKTFSQTASIGDKMELKSMAERVVNGNLRTLIGRV